MKIIPVPIIVFIFVLSLASFAHADPKKGEELFTTKKCATCHGVGGTGGKKGPDISHIGSKLTREELIVWISDPQAKKPDTKMPKPRITEQELKDVVDYLQALK